VQNYILNFPSGFLHFTALMPPVAAAAKDRSSTWFRDAIRQILNNPVEGRHGSNY
jgi:hypothetical protein